MSGTDESKFLRARQPIPQMISNIYMGNLPKQGRPQCNAPLAPFRTFGPIPRQVVRCRVRDELPRNTYGSPLVKYIPGSGKVIVGYEKSNFSRIVETWPPIL